jgi:hypothetical protein
MLPIPQNCPTQFNQALRLSAVHVPFHVHYRKWLRYFLDFCGKYPPPDAKSEQIRFEDGALSVHGKGDKDRAVPLPQRIMPELKDPLETVSALHEKDPAAVYSGVFERAPAQTIFVRKNYLWFSRLTRLYESI